MLPLSQRRDSTGYQKRCRKQRCRIWRQSDRVEEVNEKLPRGKTSMAENDWIYVTDESDLSDGKMMPVYPLGVHVLLAKVDNLIYALSGKCVHMACPLYTGTLEGNILTCPCHDWRYNIKTGEFLDATELRLETYQMKSENGKLFIMLTKGEL